MMNARQLASYAVEKLLYGAGKRGYLAFALLFV